MKKKIIGLFIIFVFLSVLTFFGLITFILDKTERPESDVISGIVFFSIMLFIFITASFLLLYCYKRFPKMNLKLPMFLPNNSPNFVKNPVRKRVYIGVIIYVVVMVILLIVTVSISIVMDNTDIFPIVFFPVLGVELIALPFVLHFVKLKEIAFFVKYLNYQLDPAFQPNDTPFPKDGPATCQFFADKLIISIKNSNDEQVKEVPINYADLAFLAKPAYKRMGDMMTIVLYIYLNVKQVDIFKEIYSDYEQTPENEKEDLYQQIFTLIITPQLYNYISYYQIGVKNLEEIINYRDLLMKQNCRLGLMFYLQELFKKKSGNLENDF